MNCLGSTLSHCAKNHTRLESLFRKKQVPSLHAHHPRHTHAPHGHIHHTLYAHVYTCTHCGRKGHLAKFCYDRVHDSNLVTKFVWVRQGTNPHRPKRVWIPKTDHPYYIWCRSALSHAMRVMVPCDGCVPSFMRTIWMHHFQWEFWWEDHRVLETWRVALIGLVTIFYSSFIIYMLFILFIISMF